MNKIICYCNNVSEQTIQDAIARGAKSLKEIQLETGACTGNKCKELNPSGNCCSSEINSLLPPPANSVNNSCGCCG